MNEAHKICRLRLQRMSNRAAARDTWGAKSREVSPHFRLARAQGCELTRQRGRLLTILKSLTQPFTERRSQLRKRVASSQ